MSLRDSILSAGDIRSETVTVPEWGVTVVVKSMNGAERGAFMSTFADQSGRVDLGTAIADVIINTVHDPETGGRVFEASDRDALNMKSGAALERLAEVGLRLSGLTADAIDAAGNGSSETPSIDSTTN